MSLDSPLYTYSYDRYSCIIWAFHMHVLFNYLVFFTGIICIVTRVVPFRYQWVHKWSGRFYICSMLWSTAWSILIRNTGIGSAILWTFFYTLLFMCLGWFVIVLHQQKMDRLSFERLSSDLQEGAKTAAESLQERFVQAKLAIADNKTFKERMLSYKALHGALMVCSWVNITGRIMATPVAGVEYSCHTYPFYKKIDTVHGNFSESVEWVPVPENNPNYGDLPWGKDGGMGPEAWAFLLTLGGFAGGLVVGAIYTKIMQVRKTNAANADMEKELDTKSQEEL